ncbi:MAG: hypothetical protein IJH75_01680 [Mogibacterium sp.]|nr:hypothetical protein [Mogibacterium sp.]
MSVAADIRTALSGLGYPVAQNSYQGNEQTYFVFNLQRIPVNFADDTPQVERVLIQLHLYAPITFNTATIERTVQQTLFGLGYAYPATENVSDRESQHLVFETEALEAITWQT